MERDEFSLTIRQTVFGVTAVVILSKIFGFFREIAIAERFGTSHEYDIFLLAISVPIFFQMVLMRATNFLCVPLLSKKNNGENSAEDWGQIWSLFNSLLVVSVLFSGLVALAAPFIVPLIGTELNGEDLKYGIFYCRAISITIVLAFLESFLRSALNVKKQFAYPALGIILLNGVIISCIYLFSAKFSVVSILMGMIIGLFFQVVFLLLKLWNLKIVRLFKFNLFDVYIKKALSVGGLIVMVELMMTTFFLIDRYFASDLAAGAVAAIKYAGVLVMLPVSVIGFTIATVTFPYLSERAEPNRRAEFSKLIFSSLSLALVLALPCGMFYYLFSNELIAALFYYGAFDLKSLHMTSEVLKMFSPYLVCLFLYTLLIQAFYSSDKARIVFYISGLAMILKFGLTWLLKIKFDYPGIALATSITHIVIFISLILYLRSKLLLVGLNRLVGKGAKILIAACPIIILRLLFDDHIYFVGGEDWLAQLRVVPEAFLSLILFIIIGYFLKIEEINSFLRGIKISRRVSGG